MTPAATCNENCDAHLREAKVTRCVCGPKPTLGLCDVCRKPSTRYPLHGWWLCPSCWDMPTSEIAARMLPAGVLS